MSDIASSQNWILSKISAAIMAGDFAQASAFAEQAVASQIRHPIIFKARALRMDQIGRYADALANFQEARRFEPNDTTVLGGIAISFARLGNFPEALRAIDASIALNPRSAGAHYHRGWIFEMSGENPRNAREAYLRVLELSPNHMGALSGLAAIAVRQHDWAEARNKGSLILAKDPLHATANVAVASSEIEDKEFAAAEKRLRAVLAGSASLPLNVKAVVNGLLADALDGQDKVAEAFAAHTAENDAERELHARFKTSDAVPAANALLSFLEELAPGQWQKPADMETGNEDVRQHVFLMGFPRSGTTLLEQILASHPDVIGLEERECMAEAGRTYVTSKSGLENLMNIPDGALVEARKAYWRAVRGYGVDPAGKTFVDKVPMHSIKMPLIAKLFPKAKILFALRDPRDVVLSCFRRHFQISVVTYEFLTLTGTAQMYDRVMRIGELSREKLPIDCLVQRHEDLVADLEGQVRNICRFLDMEWTDTMADFAQTARNRDIRSLSAAQVRRGLSREGLDQWRRYATQMADVLPILQPWVDKFGYPPA